MKKILILGGSHRDIPLINAAKELGYFVITLGSKAYYIGHKYSDKAYLVDFNDLEAVEKIYIQEKVSFLLPGCGEESYLNTVKLSKKLAIGNMDSLETAKLIHNKWTFKEFCLANNISVPKGYHHRAKKETLNFPVVVKPTNLSGGRGVEIVHNENELHKALTLAQQHTDEIFLEEYIEGELIAYSVFIQDQKIVYSFSGADISYLNKYLITTAYPIQLSFDTQKRLHNDVESIAKKLQLKNGMFHLQVIVKERIPYIIDVTRRIAGDLYPYLIEQCHGIEYSKAVVEAYTQGSITQNLIPTKNAFVIRHVVMPDTNGTYKGLFIDEKIKDSITLRLDLLNKETKIKDYLHTQLAIVFIQSEDTKIVTNLLDYIYPLVEKVGNNAG